MESLPRVEEGDDSEDVAPPEVKFHHCYNDLIQKLDHLITVKWTSFLELLALIMVKFGPDAAVAQLVVVGGRPADPAHVGVVPARRKTEDSNTKANSCKIKKIIF